MIERKTILQMYAAAVCFFTLVFGIIAGGRMIGSALGVISPEYFASGPEHRVRHGGRGHMHSHSRGHGHHDSRREGRHSDRRKKGHSDGHDRHSENESRHDRRSNEERMDRGRDDFSDEHERHSENERTVQDDAADRHDAHSEGERMHSPSKGKADKAYHKKRYGNKRRMAVRSMVRSMIYVLLCGIFFFVHWRILQRSPEK